MSTDAHVNSQGVADAVLELEVDGVATGASPDNIRDQGSGVNAALEDDLFCEDALFGEMDDITGESPSKSAGIAAISPDRLAAEIAGYLCEGCDLGALSMKKVYEELGSRLQLDVSTFDDEFKNKVKGLVTQRVEKLTATPADSDENNTGANCATTERMKDNKDEKKRRRAKADQADDKTPEKQSKKSRRSGSDTQEPAGEPLIVDIAGSQFVAKPRETSSGKLGHFGTGKVIAVVDGKKVELQCLFQCAVMGPVEESTYAADSPAVV